MESREDPDARSAREALSGAASVRAHLSTKVTAPSWYHWGAAAATAALFFGIGMTVSGMESLGSIVLVLGAVVGPAVLLAALRHATGVALDRYSSGMGWWYVVVFGLFVVAFSLEVLGGVPSVLYAAGIIAAGTTLWRERQLDRLIRARVQGEVRGV